MPNQKLVLFDLDGTLVDAYQAIYQSLCAVQSTLGCKHVSFRKVKSAVGRGDSDFLARFVSSACLPKALFFFRRRHKQDLKRFTKLRPYTQEILSTLKRRKYILGVVSNRPQQFTNFILQVTKLSRYFSCVLCPRKVSDRKPSPRMILRAMRMFRISPRDTWYIGDMTGDVQAGSAAGVSVIAVTGGSSSRKSLMRVHPKKILASLRKIPTIV